MSIELRLDYVLRDTTLHADFDKLKDYKNQKFGKFFITKWSDTLYRVEGLLDISIYTSSTPAWVHIHIADQQNFKDQLGDVIQCLYQFLEHMQVVDNKRVIATLEKGDKT